MNEIKGIFIKELKNRFLCEVNIDGAPQECYIASSCHLANFLALPGKEVILRENKSQKARTKYTIRSFVLKGEEIPLEMAVSNRVIESEIHRKLFNFLGPRQDVQREHVVDDYKSDLFIEDTNTLIEVKSVLTTDKSALFPSVYSERAIQQLRSIHKLLDKGYRIYYFFVSLNPKVVSIEINDTSKEFVEIFHSCVNHGMKYYGFSIYTENGNSTIKKRIPVVMNPYGSHGVQELPDASGGELWIQEIKNDMSP